MSGVKHTTKWNAPAVDMHGLELPSREPAAVTRVDWKPPPAAPMESLHALAQAEILLACSQPITGYNKTTIAGYFCPMWEPKIILCQGTSHWPKTFSDLHFRLKVYYPVFLSSHFTSVRSASQSWGLFSPVSNPLLYPSQAFSPINISHA